MDRARSILLSLPVLAAACTPAPGPRADVSPPAALSAPSASQQPRREADAGARRGLPKALEQVAAQLNDSFQGCAARNTTLTGRVVMKVTVEPDGTVSQVQDVTDTLGGAPSAGPGAHQPLQDKQVRACVAEVWRKAHFSEPPASTVTFHWPTFFSPAPREQVDEELR
jgi:hypothetical protein